MTDFLLQILSMKLEDFCQLSVIEKGHVTLVHNMICLNKYNNFPKMCHLSSAHLTSAEKLLGFATMTSRYQNNSVSCLSISYGMTPLRYLWQNMTIWKYHPKHLRHLCKPFGYHTIMYETPHMHTIIPFPLCRDRSSVLFYSEVQLWQSCALPGICLNRGMWKLRAWQDKNITQQNIFCFCSQ